MIGVNVTYVVSPAEVLDAARVSADRGSEILREMGGGIISVPEAVQQLGLPDGWEARLADLRDVLMANYRRHDLLRIVTTLANSDPCFHDGDCHWCALCPAQAPTLETDHAATCPWRMAREALS